MAEWGGVLVGGGLGKAFSCPCEIWLANCLIASVQSRTLKVLRCVSLFRQKQGGGYLLKAGQRAFLWFHHM